MNYVQIISCMYKHLPSPCSFLLACIYWCNKIILASIVEWLKNGGQTVDLWLTKLILRASYCCYIHIAIQMHKRSADSFATFADICCALLFAYTHCTILVRIPTIIGTNTYTAWAFDSNFVLLNSSLICSELMEITHAFIAPRKRIPF